MNLRALFLVILWFCYATNSKAQISFLKDTKVFSWGNSIARSSDKITIDTSYRLYVRKICRANNVTYARPFGSSVVRDECVNVATPNVLTEIQYLYYSKKKGNALFITFIPNYPVTENGLPRYNSASIRDGNSVNIWYANAFVFGKLNHTDDTISFLHWKGARGCPRYTLWAVKISADESSVEIQGVLDPNDKGKGSWMAVGNSLGVNVTYHYSHTFYPIVVDGTLLDSENPSCSLRQVFYFRYTGPEEYELLVPLAQCVGKSVAEYEAMSFSGKKRWGSRVPFDPTRCFD